MPKDKPKFKVGDYVIGNDRNTYAITRRGRTCRVAAVGNFGTGDDIKVFAVLEDGSERGEFSVKSEFFDKCAAPEKPKPPRKLTLAMGKVPKATEREAFSFLKTEGSVPDSIGCARKGAALLDAYFGDRRWVKKIKATKLHLSSCADCVLGQVFGDYSVGLGKLRAAFGDVVDSGSYGFDSEHDEGEGIETSYETLNAAWKAVLAKLAPAKKVAAKKKR